MVVPKWTKTKRTAGTAMNWFKSFGLAIIKAVVRVEKVYVSTVAYRPH